MSALAVWKRLLWKEFREGWLALVVTAVAPAVVFFAASVLRGLPLSQRTFVYIAYISAHAVIVLWASRNGESNADKGGQGLANLAVSPIAQWIVSVVVPCAAVGLVGLWIGFSQSLVHGNSLERYLGWLAVNVRHIPGTALLLMATYVGVYAVSAIATRWLAMALWIFAFVIWLGDMARHNASSFPMWCLFGSLVTSLLFHLLAHRKTMRYSRAAPAVLLLLICLSPYAGDFLKGRQSPRTWQMRVDISSEDGAMRLWSVSMGLPSTFPRFDPNTYVLQDRRPGRSYRKRFAPVTVPLGFAGKDRVIVAHQAPKSTDVTILQWRPSYGHLKTLATAPVGHERALAYSSYQGAVSPDGHYLLLSVPAARGAGDDLWEVDLRTGVANVAWPKEMGSQVGEVAWTPGSAILTGYSRGPVVVDLKSMLAERSSIQQMTGRRHD